MSSRVSRCVAHELPNELLSRIFLTFARDEYEQWCQLIHFICVSLGGQEPPFALLPDPLTHVFKLVMVCRRWRAFAVDCAPLWSNIAIRSASTATISMLLERSKQEPLDICCVLSSTWQRNVIMDKQLSLALREIGRTRSFRLYLRAADIEWEPMELHAPLHAPLLESLSVVYVGKSPDRQTSRIPIRDVGTNWTTPRLYRYSVNGGRDIPWAPETHLALNFKATLTQFIWLPSPDSRILCPSAEILLSVLRHLPLLDTLQIAVANRYPQVPIVSLAERSDIDPVPLPKLRRLLLEGHIQICIDVLEHLKYPGPLQQLVVTAGGSQRDPLPGSMCVSDYLVEMIQGDAQTSGSDSSKNPIPLRPMLMLGFRPDDELPDATRVMACHKIKYPERFPTTRRLDMGSDDSFEDTDIAFTIPENLPRNHLEKLFKGITLKTVQIHHFHTYVTEGECIPDAWLKASTLLKEVHTLEIGNGLPPKMVTTLLTSPGNAEGEVTHNFPRLKTVRLQGVHCKEEQESFSWRLGDPPGSSSCLGIPFISFRPYMHQLFQPRIKLPKNLTPS